MAALPANDELLCWAQPVARMSDRRPATLDSLYITYWSVRDPLCESQSLPILRALAERGFSLGLVTFEPARWAMEQPERERRRRELLAEGIAWVSLRYHSRPRVLSSAWDILAGVSTSLRVVRKRGVRLIHSRGTVPAAMACVASRLAGAGFFNDADSPISEEYADVGIWPRGGALYRVTRSVEHWALRSADAVAVLTEVRRGQVEGLTKAPPVVIPCAVDVELFQRDAHAGTRLRGELGLTGTVFVYAGKAGGWYDTTSMLDYVAAARQVFGEVSLLVLTNESPGAFTRPAIARGIRCITRSASRAEMPALLSTADVGLSFVLSAPSKTTSSPVKNGEYLACGLPVVTTTGIGDYSALIPERRVGVAVDARDREAYVRTASELKSLLGDPSLAERCRATAVAELGLAQVAIPRYVDLYERLLGQRRNRPAYDPRFNRP